MKHMQILVIRPGAIGDVLLTFPVLQILRKEYVNPHITLVSNPVVLPLALASQIVDEAFDYQDIRWSELFSETGIKTPSVRDLLAQTDLAICWLRDPDHTVEQNISKAGVKHVIVAPGRPPENSHIHIVDHLAATIEAITPGDRRGGSGADEGWRPLWPPAVGQDSCRSPRSPNGLCASFSKDQARVSPCDRSGGIPTHLPAHCLLLQSHCASRGIY